MPFERCKVERKIPTGAGKLPKAPNRMTSSLDYSPGSGVQVFGFMKVCKQSSWHSFPSIESLISLSDIALLVIPPITQLNTRMHHQCGFHHHHLLRRSPGTRSGQVEADRRSSGKAPGLKAPEADAVEVGSGQGRGENSQGLHGPLLSRPRRETEGACTTAHQ